MGRGERSLCLAGRAVGNLGHLGAAWDGMELDFNLVILIMSRYVCAGTELSAGQHWRRRGIQDGTPEAFCPSRPYRIVPLGVLRLPHPPAHPTSISPCSTPSAAAHDGKWNYIFITPCFSPELRSMSTGLNLKSDGYRVIVFTLALLWGKKISASIQVLFLSRTWGSGRGAFLLWWAELPPLETPSTALLTVCCKPPVYMFVASSGPPPLLFPLPGTHFPHISRASSPFRSQLKCHLLREALPDQLAQKAPRLLPIPSSS